eukprot:152527-Pleurochrysis_carterae.AAC.2
MEFQGHPLTKQGKRAKRMQEQHMKMDRACRKLLRAVNAKYTDTKRKLYGRRRRESRSKEANGASGSFPVSFALKACVTYRRCPPQALARCARSRTIQRILSCDDISFALRAQFSVRRC